MDILNIIVGLFLIGIGFLVKSSPRLQLRITPIRFKDKAETEKLFGEIKTLIDKK